MDKHDEALSPCFAMLCWIQASDVYSNQDKTEVGITCVNVFQHLDKFNVIECN